MAASINTGVATDRRIGNFPGTLFVLSSSGLVPSPSIPLSFSLPLSRWKKTTFGIYGTGGEGKILSARLHCVFIDFFDLSLKFRSLYVPISCNLWANQLHSYIKRPFVPSNRTDGLTLKQKVTVLLDVLLTYTDGILV